MTEINWTPEHSAVLNKEQIEFVGDVNIAVRRLLSDIKDRVKTLEHNQESLSHGLMTVELGFMMINRAICQPRGWIE